MQNNELKVIVFAKRLLKHTTKIVNNQNRFPKKYRFSLANPIQDDARNILRYLYKANYLRTTDQEQLKRRVSYQLEAICLCDLMLLNVETILDESCISDSSCEYWARLIIDVKRMAISWRSGDLVKLNELR